MTGKLPRPTPIAEQDDPSMPMQEPVRNPILRPSRIISIDAGKTDSMTPRCCMVTGRLAHIRMSGGTMVSTASADEANISVLQLWVSAWQIASRAMLRSARRGMPVEAAAVGSTLIDPSIGRAP
jgi:hypothetical protein